MFAILIEGRSALRNPSGPCGAELILSADAKGVILQHAPFREFFEDMETLGCRLPDIESEIELIGMYGAETLAVTLNGENHAKKDLVAYQHQLQERLLIPVICPLSESVDSLFDIIKGFIKTSFLKELNI